MIITLSGKPGGGKSTLGRELRNRLGLMHYSIGDFMREIAKNRNITLLELSKIAETDHSVDEELDARQIKLGKEEDNFVIDARIAFHFIPNSIRIFLDVDLDVAAKRILQSKRRTEEKKPLEEEKQDILKRIESEKKRYYQYYGIEDFSDPKHYDFVMDTSNQNVEEMVEEIIRFLKIRPEFQEYVKQRGIKL